MYSNNILDFQESTTILNACTKKVWKLIRCVAYFQNFLYQAVSHNFVLTMKTCDIKKMHLIICTNETVCFVSEVDNKLTIFTAEG